MFQSSNFYNVHNKYQYYLNISDKHTQLFEGSRIANITSSAVKVNLNIDEFNRKENEQIEILDKVEFHEEVDPTIFMMISPGDFPIFFRWLNSIWPFLYLFSCSNLSCEGNKTFLSSYQNHKHFAERCSSLLLWYQQSWDRSESCVFVPP